MLQVDSLVQSFLDFIKKFWRAFFHTIFKPVKMMGRIQNETAGKTYTGVYTYFYISTYLSFLVFYAGNFGWFSALDPHSYQLAFDQLNGASLLFLIIIIIPYTLLIGFLIYLFIKILRFHKGWFKVVYIYAIYYFSSFLLSTVAMVGFLLIILIGVPKKETDGATINQTLANILNFILEHIIFNSPYILAVIPLALIVRYYFKINKWRTAQFAILLSGCFFLAWYNEFWFKKLNTVFQQQNNPDTEERKVFINNYNGAYSELTMNIDSSNQTISANLFLINNTKFTYLASVEDSIRVYKIPPDKSDPALLFTLGIKQWDNEANQVSYLLKPDEIKRIQLQGILAWPPVKDRDGILDSCRLVFPATEFSQEAGLPETSHIWEGHISLRNVRNQRPQEH